MNFFMNPDNLSDGICRISMCDKPEIEFSHLPVTALAFLDSHEHLIVGQGPHLRILDGRTSICVYSRQIFVNQAVHGITVNPVTASRHVVLVWGGRVFRSFIIDILPKWSVHLGPIETCSDWIVHCTFGNELHTSPPALAVAVAITAHNALILFTFNLIGGSAEAIPRSKLEIKQTPLSAVTRCMLYSAQVQWLSENQIIVAAGTPFGTIIIWSCFINRLLPIASLQSLVRTHYAFTAHENGAIFGVTLIHDLIEDGTRRLTAVSCSDDRTIKAWDVSGALSVLSPFVNGSTESSAVEGLEQPNLDHQYSCHSSLSTPSCFATTSPFSPHRLYGHMSRIWKIGLIASGEAARSSTCPKVLASLGEDATVQLWNLEEGLSHFKTYSNHFGKNIWSFATAVLNPERVILATGGADGAIVTTMPMFSRKNFMREPRRLRSNGAHETAEDTNVDSKTWLNKLKTYGFVDSETILATTADGHVVIGSQNRKEADSLENQQFEFQNKSKLEDLQGYSTITTLPSLGIGFLAGAKGDVYCYQSGRERLFPVAPMSGKVGGMFSQALSASMDDKDSSSQLDTHKAEVALLVTQMRINSAQLLILQAEMENGNCVSVTRTSSANALEDSVLDLVIPNGTSITSMLYVPLDKCRMLLLLGARDGTVTQYISSHSRRSEAEDNISGDQSLEHGNMRSGRSFYHHQDAVTCMKWHEEELALGTASNGFLFSTGRDSTCTIHRYSLDHLKTTPELVHRITLPFGPNIEGFYFAGPERSMYLYGFRGEDFVVFDEQTQTEKMKVRCGGAHRQWCFHPSSTSDEATFVWTRASTFYTHTASTSAAHWLQPGSHGREIKACAVSPKVFRKHGIPYFLFATGAEDTEIRLFEYPVNSKDTSDIRSAGILRKHVTGLQHLQWSADGSYLFSSGGREEFCVWRVQPSPFVNLGVVCESTLPAISDVPDLRIMGFDVMAIDDFTSKPSSNLGAGFLVSMVLSNSTVRVYKYDNSTAGRAWQLLATGTFALSCLTIGEYIFHSGRYSLDPDTGIDFLTAGTDGAIGIWQLPKLTQMDTHASEQRLKIRSNARSKAHQNTVKCHASISLSQPSGQMDCRYCLIIAGGDDNALSFNLVRKPPSLSHEGLIPSEAHTIETLLLPRAHAASITGLVAWNREPHKVQTEHGCSRERPLTGVAMIRVVSISNDQQMKVWDVDVGLESLSTDGIKVKRMAKISSAVSDASSAVILEADGIEPDSSSSVGENYVRVVVCGVGFEIWRIPRYNDISTNLQAILDT